MDAFEAFPDDFQVPNYVRLRFKGVQEPTTIELSVLTPYALDILCKNFRAEVFKKAGKKDPALGEKK